MDRYIDQHEVFGYTVFATQQITELIVPLDPAFKKALVDLVGRIEGAAASMKAALEKAGAVDVETYAGANAAIAGARATLKRAVHYAASRPNGEAIVAAMLGGESLSAVTKRRPAKLANALAR